jgi:hypothetical protein
VVLDALSRQHHYETLNLLSYEEYIQAFLENRTIPPDDPNIERELRDKAKNFVLEDGVLMRYYPDGMLVRVVLALDRGIMIKSIHREIRYALARTIINLLKVRG